MGHTRGRLAATTGEFRKAEREGFEPSIEFPLYTLSKRAPSASRTPLLQIFLFEMITERLVTCQFKMIWGFHHFFRLSEMRLYRSFGYPIIRLLRKTREKQSRVRHSRDNGNSFPSKAAAEWILTFAGTTRFAVTILIQKMPAHFLEFRGHGFLGSVSPGIPGVRNPQIVMTQY